MEFKEKSRVIARLDIKGPNLIKGISYEGLRILGSPKEFAEKYYLAGIDEFSASARVNQYERGVHMPNYSTATRLAEVLDVPVSYLYEPNNKMAELILEASRLDAKGQAAVLKLARKLALNT